MNIMYDSMIKLTFRDLLLYHKVKLKYESKHSSATEECICFIKLMIWNKRIPPGFPRFLSAPGFESWLKLCWKKFQLV